MTSRRDAIKVAPRRRGRVVRAQDWRPESPEFGSHSQQFEIQGHELLIASFFFSSSLFATSSSKCVSVACLNASSVQLRA